MAASPAAANKTTGPLCSRIFPLTRHLPVARILSCEMNKDEQKRGRGGEADWNLNVFNFEPKLWMQILKGVVSLGWWVFPFRCPVVSDEKSYNRIGYFSDNKEIDWMGPLPMLRFFMHFSHQQSLLFWSGKSGNPRSGSCKWSWCLLNVVM